MSSISVLDQRPALVPVRRLGVTLGRHQHDVLVVGLVGRPRVRADHRHEVGLDDTERRVWDGLTMADRGELLRLMDKAFAAIDHAAAVK